MFCAKCGKQMNEREEILGDGCLHIIGSCFECNIQKDIGIVVEGGMIPAEYVQHDSVPHNEVQNVSYEPRRNRVKKKDSALSVIAFVFAIITFMMPVILAVVFGFVAFILALIDLGIHNDNERHLGSWIALVVCVLIGIVVWGSCSSVF